MSGKLGLFTFLDISCGVNSAFLGFSCCVWFIPDNTMLAKVITASVKKIHQLSQVCCRFVSLMGVHPV